MKDAKMLMLLGAGMVLHIHPDLLLGKVKTNQAISDKPLRTCLKCGKVKFHNNSFCSAKCCKEYKKCKLS